MESLEKKESKLVAREQELEKIRIEVEQSHAMQLAELEKISGLTSEQAKEYLIKTVEDEVKHETAVMIKEMESRNVLLTMWQNQRSPSYSCRTMR